MAKKKVYAVKQGKKQGIFYSWEECKASVEGYPGAEFKGFSSEQEARQYLGTVFRADCEAEAEARRKSIKKAAEPESGDSNIRSTKEAEAENSSAGNAAAEAERAAGERHDRNIPAGCVTAYVDGSFNKKIGRYSFGCVLLLPGGDILKKSGNGSNPESLAIRNVAGEMLGAMYAVKWARKNEYHSIEICYDYEGIEKWANGRWRTNNSLTKKYAEYMQRQAGGIEIKFRKVAAHTGDFYNEEADKLAKKALTDAEGIPETVKE